MNGENERIVALHIANEECLEIAKHNAQLVDDAKRGNIMFFALKSVKKPDFATDEQWVEFPESLDIVPKQKNFIIDYVNAKGFTGFLHIVEDSIKFNDMTLAYMDKLESTMRALDYGIHFSTITDRCNFVFSKFSPRLTLDVDDEDMKKALGLPDKIFFTSHSNVSYVTFDFKAAEGHPQKFDERFSIGMFYIIEFLSRRRATRKDGQLYYMNQYMAISDEVGAYEVAYEPKTRDSSNEDTMKAENELFMSLGVDYAPDNNIDVVLDAFYSKLKSKLA